MLTNWDTKAEQHNHSHKIWFEVVEKFRNTKNEEDIWPDDVTEELNQIFTKASNNSIEIKSIVFNRYKAKYLAKVEISKFISNNPGCPYFIAQIFVFFISLRKINS